MRRVHDCEATQFFRLNLAASAALIVAIQVAALVDEKPFLLFDRRGVNRWERASEPVPAYMTLEIRFQPGWRGSCWTGCGWIARAGARRGRPRWSSRQDLTYSQARKRPSTAALLSAGLWLAASKAGAVTLSLGFVGREWGGLAVGSSISASAPFAQRHTH